MNQRFTVRQWSLVPLVVMLVITLTDQSVFAQAGLRESLERLDRDEDGRIDPDEITPLARPYLERILRDRGRRADFDEPISIERIQEAARSYYAVRNGVSGRDVRPEGKSTVMPFGPTEDEPLVPGFGLAVVKYPYLQEDLDEADSTIRRYDENDDGYVDRAEAADSKWTHRNPFDDDLNKDGRLSRMELTQRYARRRLLDGAADELRQKAWRTDNGIRSSKPENDRESDSQWWRRGGTGTWLSASMMGRFDLNRNGRLELSEAQSLGIPAAQIDSDRDGEVTREELHALLTEMQEAAGDVTQGLPGWFYELDADRDGQVSIPEFSAEWSGARLTEFQALDLNDDGLLTATEVLRSSAVVGGNYRQENAEVLPPRRTIISEIEVADDFPIHDLNVQISITHSHTDYLDAYLTGPDGDRVELFTEVGGSGDHFDQTVFDDQSGAPITKGKTPFNGTFRPEALDKKQPGLSIFNGKSVKGVWQLVIRGTRNDRFGMLHSWGLAVTPGEGIPTVPVPDSAETSVTESESDDVEEAALGDQAGLEPDGKDD